MIRSVIRCVSSFKVLINTVINMTHKNTALKSVTQSGTIRSERSSHFSQITSVAEVSSSQSTEIRDEQSLLSVKKVTYSDLITAVKELQKGHKN